MADVLIVDDDPQIRDLLRLYVERDGHRVRAAADGPSALIAAAASRPDLVILDVMLPGLDGFEVARRLRDESDVPILLLTARSGDSDKVIGLEHADDYVVKPFSPRELMARVRVQLRRHRPREAAQPILLADGLALDPNAIEVALDGHPIAATPAEFRLLHALMRGAGRVLSRDTLVEAVHPDQDSGVIDRSIDVHLGRLRRKLGDSAATPRFITTVRTVGYKFIPSVHERPMP